MKLLSGPFLHHFPPQIPVLPSTLPSSSLSAYLKHSRPQNRSCLTPAPTLPPSLFCSPSKKQQITAKVAIMDVDTSDVDTITVSQTFSDLPQPSSTICLHCTVPISAYSAHWPAHAVQLSCPVNVLLGSSNYISPPLTMTFTAHALLYGQVDDAKEN
jgi:hypothetical protein